MQSRRRVERIVLAPAPTEYGPKARAKAGILPALQGTAIDVWTQNERTVARLANSETIVVTDWRAEADIGQGV